jgi:hypothetical protein
MVTLGRFELPTCGLGNRRSIHLSYRATGESLYEVGGFPEGSERRLSVPEEGTWDPGGPHEALAPLNSRAIKLLRGQCYTRKHSASRPRWSEGSGKLGRKWTFCDNQLVDPLHR